MASHGLRWLAHVSILCMLRLTAFEKEGRMLHEISPPLLPFSRSYRSVALSVARWGRYSQKLAPIKAKYPEFSQKMSPRFYDSARFFSEEMLFGR